MERRAFIQASVFLTVATLMSAGSCSQGPDVDGEPLLAAGSADEDVRIRSLRYAIWAPNSHNVQPWLVDLRRDGELDLYVDRSRLLPQTDPFARQIHISQGTFLELLCLAASEFGHRTELRYYPRGEYGAGEVSDMPVATVVFRADSMVRKDPLFAEIPRRLTNKCPYSIHASLTPAHIAAIQAAPGTGRFPLLLVMDPDRRQALSRMCRDAMRIEVSSRARNRETAAWFRFSDREAREKRDGFGLAQNGVSGLKKWMAEAFLSRSRAEDPDGSFARGAIDMVEKQASSAPTFAALVSPTNRRLDQLLVGRVYARIHLAVTGLGLTMQPLSQILEEYSEMGELQRSFKDLLNIPQDHTVQMLFRIGQASPTPHTFRRGVRALVRNASAWQQTR